MSQGEISRESAVKSGPDPRKADGPRSVTQFKRQLAALPYEQQVQMVAPAMPAADGFKVQLKAVQLAPGPTPQPTGTIPGVSSSVAPAPALQNTADPNSFSGSKGKYEANFEAVKGNIASRGGTPDQVATFDGKKGDWYRRWGVACLQADADAAKGEFQKIEADLKAMFPDDRPSSGSGHLYTGYAGGGSGRGRAEAMAGGENAKPANQNVGITHRTLEKTLVGNLFDGVALDKKDPNEQKQWIPYKGSKAGEWWSQISASYANTFTGAVHAHVDVGLVYYTKQVGEGQPAADRRKMRGELANAITLHSSVFRDDELPRVADGMKEGRVTELIVHLKIEVTEGNIINTDYTIPAGGIATGADLTRLISAKIKSLVSVDDILPNIK